MPAELGAFKISVISTGEDEDGFPSYSSLNFFLVRDLGIYKTHIRFMYLANTIEVKSDGQHIRQKNPNESMLEFFNAIAKETNGYWVERYIYDFDQFVLYGRFEYDEVENMNVLTERFYHAKPEEKSSPVEEKQVLPFPNRPKKED